MTTVNIHEAKTRLSELLQRMNAGEEIVIAKAGRPVARLCPFEGPTQQRRAGMDRGKAWISDDFDAPLPEETIKDFEDRT